MLAARFGFPKSNAFAIPHVDFISTYHHDLYIISLSFSASAAVTTLHTAHPAPYEHPYEMMAYMMPIALAEGLEHDGFVHDAFLSSAYRRLYEFAYKTAI